MVQIINGDVRHVRHLAYLANEEFIGSFQSSCLLISEDEGDLHVGGDHVGDGVRRRVRDLVVREERALCRLQQCRGRHFHFKIFRFWFLICLCGYSCEERQRGGGLGTRRRREQLERLLRRLHPPLRGLNVDIFQG